MFATVFDPLEELREAVMLAAHQCIWNGCNRSTTGCEADHLTDWSHDGGTDVGSGAPLCPPRRQRGLRW